MCFSELMEISRKYNLPKYFRFFLGFLGKSILTKKISFCLTASKLYSIRVQRSIINTFDIFPRWPVDPQMVVTEAVVKRFSKCYFMGLYRGYIYPISRFCLISVHCYLSVKTEMYRILYFMCIVCKYF